MPYTAQVLDAAPAEVQTGLRHAAPSFSHFTILETGRAHGAFQEPLDRFNWLAAGGCLRRHRIDTASSETWSELAAAWRAKPTWWFGVIAYDAKNALEATIESRHGALSNQPDWDFYEPEWVVQCQGTLLTLHRPRSITSTAAEWWADIELRAKQSRRGMEDRLKSTHPPVRLQSEHSEAEYLRKARSLQAFMNKGDLYEANLCMRWSGQGWADPIHAYQSLQNRADAPMAGLHKSPEAWLLSASPERYLSIRNEENGQVAYSQPIKGTAERHRPAADLLASEKERAENTMIVDLVRNDLSRVARPTTVTVPRYLQVRSLPTVHHLVSTVRAELRSEADWISVIQASFPMGSMTGAPKIRAMQRIDEHESARRAWYSGALGYVSPEGECDFNVVIRSLMANADCDQWSAWAGSALTVWADPEQEWKELKLKMKAPMAALGTHE